MILRDDNLMFSHGALAQCPGILANYVVTVGHQINLHKQPDKLNSNSRENCYTVNQIHIQQIDMGSGSVKDVEYWLFWPV